MTVHSKCTLYSILRSKCLIRFLAETFKHVLDTSVGVPLLRSAHRWQLLGTSSAKVAKICFGIILKGKDHAFRFLKVSLLTSVFQDYLYKDLLAEAIS